MRRIFVAIPVQAAHASLLKKAAETAGSISGVRWTPPENYHITVYFIGSIEEVHLASIQEALKNVMPSVSAFTLLPEALQLYPPGKQNMIWARFQLNKDFQNCVEICRSAFQPFLKIPPSHENPIPHITLARIRAFSEKQHIVLPRIELPPVEADSCELWESIRTPSGVRYECLIAYPLRPDRYS
jgi:RNA 2',3'-cyclic 3'-phosphodiesterase